ncbi:MAG: molecular chaperone HtpG, partial [Deinococcus-Thermus bacterium]|nr:molecular chaperone HtpG [Deinococcota bacterium]
LRYAALTEPELAADDPDYRIRLEPDAAARTLAIVDNGLGMDRDDLVGNLGTIARSGTGAFLDKLTGDAKKDLAMIGQFGVGFYSAFMVADRVEVITRKAGEHHAWRWESDGKGSFTVAPAGGAAVPRGTRVVLHLAEDAAEFAEPERLKHVVRTHSDHIAIPIRLAGAGADGSDEDGDDETINRASALWTRPKSEITADEHAEFYRHVAHAFDSPAATIHYRAEGMISYTGLLYVPSMRPMDLYDPERKGHVKLYVRRVLVSEQAEGVLPPWLRFLRGVVDSEDLPLNVSREMLQSNPMVAKIRQGLTKRVLDALAAKAKDEPEAYATLWDSFGAVLKEGLYEDPSHRDALVDLLRFKSSTQDGLAHVAGYLERRKPGQEAIYYITGDDPATALRSPHLEGFRAKGVEVAVLTDPVDEFWVGTVAELQGVPLKSVTRAGGDLAAIGGDESETDAADTPDDAEAPAAEALDGLIAALKAALGEAVKDVRRSDRLTESAVCLTADEGDLDLHLERLLKQHGQFQGAASRRVLEINPGHGLIRRLADRAAAGEPVDEIAHLLLDQARIVEGEAPADPAAFARRMSEAVLRGLA